MLRMREHIHRGKALGLIAQLCQGDKVAGKGDGVAADIDHTLGCHTRHAGKEFRGLSIFVSFLLLTPSLPFGIMPINKKSLVPITRFPVPNAF